MFGMRRRNREYLAIFGMRRKNREYLAIFGMRRRRKREYLSLMFWVFILIPLLSQYFFYLIFNSDI